MRIGFVALALSDFFSLVVSLARGVIRFIAYMMSISTQTIAQSVSKLAVPTPLVTCAVDDVDGSFQATPQPANTSEHAD